MSGMRLRLEFRWGSMQHSPNPVAGKGGSDILTLLLAFDFNFRLFGP